MTDREKLQQHLMKIELMFAQAKAEKREFTTEEASLKDRLFKECEALRYRITLNDDAGGDSYSQSQKAAAGQAFMQAVGGGNIALLPGMSRAQFEAEGGVGHGAPESAREREAYNAYLRTGERKNFAITSSVDSGALIPRSVDSHATVRRMYNAYLATLIATGFSTIQTPGTESYHVPIADDGSELGDTPAEDASADAVADPTLTHLDLPPTLWSSKTWWVSNTMLASNSVDLVGYLMPILDKRVLLNQNLAWSTRLRSLQTSGNTKTTAAADAISYTELTQWFHTLSAAYRTDACWILSDSLLAAIENLSNDLKFPLLQDSLERRMRLLLGLPFVIDQDMPAVAPGAIVGCLISGEGIKVRQCLNRRIARYKEIPTFPDQVGFRLFENGSADFIPGSFAFLRMAAS